MNQPHTSPDSFGALLSRYRKGRHVTQQRLAGAVGVGRNTIGRWERGDFLPESKGIVLELARHLRLDDQETRQFLEASLTALSPYWHVPLPRNPFFTGREAMLEALHTQLGAEHAIALTQPAALHGLGGVGKTQIALEYAYRYALDYSAVFWIASETEEQIASSFFHLAEVLQVSGNSDQDQQRVLAAVQRWLSTHRGWLLIWDNVEHLEVLDRFLPPARQGAILLTTRLQALGTHAWGIDLAPMDQEEGVLFLLRRAKLLATSEDARQFVACLPADYAAAAEVVTTMGGLPLALDQAGAYLETTQCGLPAYLDRFRTRRAALLQQRGAGAREHPASVSTTFTLALLATTQRHAVVWDLLRVCALLQPDAIPEELVREGAKHLGAGLEAVCRDPLEWDRVIALACAYSLLARHPAEQTLAMHRLVQAVLLDGLTETEREQWHQRVLAALEAVFPDVLPDSALSTRKRCACLLPHALACLHRTAPTAVPLVFASLAYKVAQYQRVSGHYAEAESLLKHALQIQEQLLGDAHPAVAQSLNYLALLSWALGKYREAEALFQRALSTWEQALGATHPDVARALHGIATLYYQQGRYTEAEALFQQAVTIWEQSLGPEHPHIASSLNNLALISMEQGRYAEAEPLYQRTLRIKEQHLGPEHPHLASSLNNLADLYRQQGKYAEAEPLYQRALTIGEQGLGSSHPTIAALLTNLATLSYQQGRYTEAEALFQRAVTIWEQSLGPEHPDVALALKGLATLFREQGQYAEAEPLYQRALSMLGQHLGPSHPRLAELLHDLAIFKHKQGRLRDAISLAERALQIRLHSLGDRHPETVESQALYAQLLQDQHKGAEPLVEQIRTLLKAQGWSVHLKKRRGKSYVYATRKVGQHTQSRYLAPLSNQVACLAAAQVLPNARKE